MAIIIKKSILINLFLWAVTAVAAQNIEIVVHRGANALAPENTWQSAKAALDYEAKWIEVDVRKSKDGVLFNLHDETLDRTTNGKGLLSDMLSEDVRKLDAGSWFGPQFAGLPVPTIADMLDSLQGKAYVFFDVKRGTPIPTLVNLVREKSFADKSFFWFGDEAMLREFIALAPEMIIKVNASDIERLKYWQSVCKPSYVEIAPEKITDKFRKYCHKHGIKVMAACQEDDISQFQLVIDKKADLVNLDRPEDFLPLLHKAQRKYTLQTDQLGIPADGKTLCTNQLQKAIDQINKKGGGRLTLTRGTYLTGCIQMRSGVELYLEEGATILGSTNPRDYEIRTSSNIADNPDEITGSALIYAQNVENVALRGKGRIDGQGLTLALTIDSLHHTGEMPDPNYNYRRMRPSKRPSLFYFHQCKNVQVEELQLQSSAGWGLVFDLCENLKLSQLNIKNRAYWNNDGIDVTDCRHVRISDCWVDAADDGICLKSHHPESCNYDIEVARCDIRSSASAVKFGTASWGGFRKIYVHDIKVQDTFRSAIAIESVDGGVTDSVLIERIDAKNTGNAFFLRLGQRAGDRPSVLRNVTIRQLRCEVPFGRPDEAYDLRGPEVDFFHNPFPSSICGYPDHRIENVTLEDIEVSHPGRATKGMAYMPLWRIRDVPEQIQKYPEFSMFGELPAWALYVRHVQGLQLHNVCFTLRDTDFRPPFVFDDAEDVTFDKVSPMENSDLPVANASIQHVNPFGYPLVPDMIADASIQVIDDTYYCYATTDGYGRGLETSGPPVVWKSKDFINWSFEGTYFPSAENQKYWAPSKAIQRSGQWYIYPTVNGYMHVAVAGSPDGPFRLCGGNDVFTMPYAESSTLLKKGERHGIDAEVFIDDDGQAYAFWGQRHVAKLAEDMVTLSEERQLETRRKEYSEGPIFFKRNGIYYYLYTIGGDENYEYYYMMSRTSPLGPYEVPANDRVCTTNIANGVFGPGHGCVFNDGDNYYLAFLEFSRNSTNRQTYVNRLEFNSDGTIREVMVSLNGVGELRHVDNRTVITPIEVKASSTMQPLAIKYFNDMRCKRTEYFGAAFAIDGSNGSRWMADDTDQDCWLMIDLGQNYSNLESELCFVRPTAGHAYLLEGSQDGVNWKSCGGHSDLQKRSPHKDRIRETYRYLRVKISEGIKGIWEWRILHDENEVIWGAWHQWGEQPDGTYRNPIIPSDYSDLDCIRVGDDYYAISSTMQFSPGMTILHSHDLVNWEIAGNAVSDLTQIGSALSWKEMDRYGRGVWAGTLRHHNGKFYLFFGTPDEGYFMTTAPKAEGPWEPLTPLLAENGWDDCTAIWDDEGHGWFLGTCFKEGYNTYLFRMADDGRSIDRSSARLVNSGNHREANKLIKHGDYYYLVFSEHKDGIGRYVMAKRDKQLTGSFAEEKQLLLPCVEAHEPNQGGIIEGRDGKWYFLTHHGHGDWSGRVVSLLPVEWVDGWPMMGNRSQGEPGTMVWKGKMPLKATGWRCQQSDDFDSRRLGPQWQWNYQPRDEKWSLGERLGWLRLKAFRPLENNRLLKAGNILTQRTFRTEQSEVTIKMDISHATDGLRAGLCHFAGHSASLGIVCQQGKNYLEFTDNDKRTVHQEIPLSMIWLKSKWGLDGMSQFYYSFDGNNYTPLGQYQLSWGFYRGDRIGIYCYNEQAESGWIDVDYMYYFQ